VSPGRDSISVNIFERELNMKAYTIFFQTLLIFLLSLTFLSCSDEDEGVITLSETSDSSPAVVSVVPVDNANDIPVNTLITVTFSEAMIPATVTANSNDTSCSGTIQLSSDNFANCIQMSSAPVFDSSNSIFSVIPAANLAYNTLHKVKVAAGAENLDQNALADDVVTENGFTTRVEPPTVVALTPVDTSTDVSIHSDLSVTFSEAMDSSTITVNTLDDSCTGSAQLSADDFATCIQMESQPTADPTSNSFTVKPAFQLEYSTTHIVKTTTDATNLIGTPMGADYIAPIGFRTIDAIVIFRIDTPVNGGFGATHQTDCESAKSTQGIPGANVKPFISIGGDSEIKNIPGIPLTGVEVISTTGIQLKPDWNSLWATTSIDYTLFSANILPSSTDRWWSGSYSNGTTSGGGAADCTDWTVDTNATTGVTGNSNDTGTTWIQGPNSTCDQLHYRLCVAW
jgi:Big-like domain-containing protein